MSPADTLRYLSALRIMLENALERNPTRVELPPLGAVTAARMVEALEAAEIDQRCHLRPREWEEKPSLVFGRGKGNGNGK